MFEVAYAIWALGMLVILLAFSWGQGQFMASLRYRHVAVWHRLGRPTITMLSSEPQAIPRLIWCVASAEYGDLADAKIRLYGATLRYSFVALSVWVAVGAALLILYGESG